MGSAKEGPVSLADDDDVRSWRWLRSAPIWTLFWPGLLVLTGYLLWHGWAADRVLPHYFGLTADGLHVSPPPAWVKADVVAEVYRAAALDQCSLTDPQAAARIAHAFAAHPWVERVIRVEKLPSGQVDVTLRYRRPVAVVMVSGKLWQLESESAFFPVDGAGVLLPPSDFQQAAQNEYLRIVIPGVYPPRGTVAGMPFGDDRVADAARLASWLVDDRAPLDLREIAPLGQASAQVGIEFVIRRGTSDEFVWGRSPGRELPGEPSAEMKLARLRSLSIGRQAKGTIDLR
jgi:hypothetical protein